MAEALDDQYNGQLRDLHERTAGAGAGDARAEALRALVRRLRDEPRALDTSVKARALGSRVRGHPIVQSWCKYCSAAP